MGEILYVIGIGGGNLGSFDNANSQHAYGTDNGKSCRYVR